MGEELVVPFTGEVVNRGDAEQVARVYSELDQAEARIKELKGLLKEALLDYSIVAGTKTLHFPGRDAVLTTPNETVWDHDVLVLLIDAGLPPERYAELVTEEITVRLKVNASVAKSIAAANPAYAEIIERAKTVRPKTPTLTVKEK